MTRYGSAFSVAAAAPLFVALVALAQTPDRRPGIPLRIGNPPSGSRLDFESARFIGPCDNFLQEYLRQSAERSFAHARLRVYSERFVGIERYEATGLELALEGVGAAATLGLFTGAAANTAGWWDEGTSWYIAGAAAAVGAFLGYRRVADPKARARYRWSTGVDSGDRHR